MNKPLPINMTPGKINQPKLQPLPPIRPANAAQTTIESNKKLQILNFFFTLKYSVPPAPSTNAAGTWRDFSTITDKTIRMKFIRKVIIN